MRRRWLLRRIEFEPRDLWTGIYWTRRRWHEMGQKVETWNVYICIIWMLPLHLAWEDYPGDMTWPDTWSTDRL